MRLSKPKNVIGKISSLKIAFRGKYYKMWSGINLHIRKIWQNFDPGAGPIKSLQHKFCAMLIFQHSD